MKNPSVPPLPGELRREPDGVELASVWELLPEPEAVASPGDTDTAWVAVRDRTSTPSRARGAAGDRGPGATEAPGPGRRRRLRVLIQVAAAAVLALGGTAAWYAVPVTHRAAAGERMEVSLPDGSRVTLNAGSTVRHRRDFSWLPGVPATARGVALEGEAFFDVSPAVRPFTVAAGAARVRVLGTRFNVRAREEGGEARVDVEEGRVEVADPLRAYTVILRAGEAARLDPASGGLSRDRIDQRRIAAWRSGGMVMVDEPLANVLDELGVRFDTEIRLLDPGAAHARLSVYYSRVGSLESVLSDLATQQDLRYRRTSDGWELF